MSEMNFHLLDCTLRDGGYYTKWDFNPETVNSYVDAMNQLPIDYLEIGYRNKPSKEYLGKFGYTPLSVLKHIRKMCNKKLVVMLNEKSTKPEDLDQLLEPIQGLADMIRIAIDPKNIDRAIVLAKSVKALGFEVGFNVMYMSKWSEMDGFYPKLSALDGVANLFCMVDSFGGVTPDNVKNTISEIRKYTQVPIGFHGHNNLQLGLINSITALNCGIEYVDATITGMGRGAGNLEMELLLTYLNKSEGLDVNFNVLSDVISTFTPLHEQYRWGTNLPYMLSGANSIPQKEVMDWVTNRTYSFNSIVRALDNRKDKVVDNAKYPEFTKDKKYDYVIIIGGGDNVRRHLEGIKDFISQRKQVAIVFATSRFVSYFEDMNVDKYYCLVGNEAKRLAVNTHHKPFTGICILPPYPRVMGTEVPEYAQNITFELDAVCFTKNYADSCTSIAIQTALDISKGEIYTIGYDGYPGEVLSEKEMALTNENREIFEAFEDYTGANLKSLTPSLYKNLAVESLYQYI